MIKEILMGEIGKDTAMTNNKRFVTQSTRILTQKNVAATGKHILVEAVARFYANLRGHILVQVVPVLSILVQRIDAKLSFTY